MRTQSRGSRASIYWSITNSSSSGEADGQEQWGNAAIVQRTQESGLQGEDFLTFLPNQVGISNMKLDSDSECGLGSIPNVSSFQVETCMTHGDSHVVAGSEDGSVYFWDLIEGKLT